MGVFKIADEIELLIKEKQYSLAEMKLQEILKNDKDCLEAWNLLGGLQIYTERVGEAIVSFSTVVSLSDRYPGGFSNLAYCYIQLNQNEFAIQAATQSLKIDPFWIDGWINLMTAQINLEKTENALLSCRKGLEVDPHHPLLLLSMGVVMTQKNEHQMAIEYFKEVIKYDKKHEVSDRAYCNIASLLTLLGNYREAWVINQKNLLLNPNSKIALMHQMSLLLYMDYPEEASIMMHTLKEQYPFDPEIELNYCKALHSILRINDAISILQKLIEQYPDFWKARTELSMNLLLIGDLKTGFQEYEHRLKMRDILPSHMAELSQIPIWNGEDINGMTLLVHEEQGIGDTIQQLRYVPYLKERYGCNVILFLSKQLHPLFNHLGFPLTDQFVAADLRVSLMSLPYILKTELFSIPSPTTFPSRHRPIKNQIGIVWRGNPGHQRNRQRSMDLSLFASLFNISSIQYVSLQKDPTTQEVALLDQHGIEHPLIETLADTMRLLEKCSQVICIDTMIAHLAGSMEIPTWIFIPYVPDWRWMLERTDSPWYPCVKLFRQPCLDDWSLPLQEVYMRIKNRKEL
ncbi:MAG: glycosyl transferase group 1 [Parachlamydiales bacterium]|nr:glycosyl transferase group 1 [Parachlamydiales bacterium]